MNLLIIHRILENKGKSFTWLCDKIQMTRANLYRRISSNDIKASDLEKIANVLEVNINTFFDDSVQKYTQLQKEVTKSDSTVNYDKLISSLEKTIEAQNLTIKLLTEELERKKNL